MEDRLSQRRNWETYEPASWAGSFSIAHRDLYGGSYPGVS